MLKKKLELGHDITVSPFSLQDDRAWRTFYCRKCRKKARLEVDLTKPGVAEEATKLSTSWFIQFEKQPCSP